MLPPKCLKCEKELKPVGDNCSNIDDAGYMEVSFHYGSRNDQMKGFIDITKFRRRRSGDPEPPPLTRRERLLKSDKIQAYICDDCFEKYEELFEGYSVHTKTDETRKV